MKDRLVSITIDLEIPHWRKMKELYGRNFDVFLGWPSLMIMID